MKYKALCRLTAAKRQEITELEKECSEYDKTERRVFLSTELNFSRSVKSFYMLYDNDDMLISFLTLFIPSADEAEVSAFTRPDRRRKGYFKQLLAMARAELADYGIDRILYVAEPVSADAGKTLAAIGAVKEYSEYMMKYDPEHDEMRKVQCNSAKDNLMIKKVLSTDREILIPITQTMFPMEREEAEHWFDSVFSSSSMKMYKAVLGDKIIGTVNVSEENDSICIYGVGIDVEMRGKGYGGELIRILMNELVSRNKAIVLEVGSKNESAFHIYQKNGFVITSQQDYYA